MAPEVLGSARVTALLRRFALDPAFVYWIGSWFTKYGPERVRWAYPGKSYFDYGIVAAAGTDVPTARCALREVVLFVVRAVAGDLHAQCSG